MTDSNQSITQTVQGIRKKLRLSMDGIVSTLMRKQGIHYKLNFGINLPRIQEIAKLYTPSEELADHLWQEDVRELKILALLLHPKELFTKEKALQWTNEIHHIEIAELFCLKLMQHTTFASECASLWIEEEREYTKTTGYILFSRLFAKELTLEDSQNIVFLNNAFKMLTDGTNRLKKAALLALKRYGQISNENANNVLNTLKTFENSSLLERSEIYNDLKFEFDY